MAEDQEKPKIEAEGDVPARYEASFLNIWTIILAGVALLVAVGLVHVLATLLFGFFAPAQAPLEQPVLPAEEDGRIPPSLRLQADAPFELRQLRATQAANLYEYGWVNQEQGVVRIPIERAMEIVAEQGAPDFAEGIDVAMPEPAQPGEAIDPADVAAAGEQVFNDFGCGSCHQAQDTSVAPGLAGIFGTQRPLADGSSVLADEAYLRTAILHPTEQVVAGFNPIMPSFEGRISDDQLEALVAFIAAWE